MCREEERKRARAAEEEVRKQVEDHQAMLQQLEASLPPEPDASSPGPLMCACVRARALGRVCVCVFVEMHVY